MRSRCPMLILTVLGAAFAGCSTPGTQDEPVPAQAEESGVVQGRGLPSPSRFPIGELKVHRGKTLTAPASFRQRPEQRPRRRLSKDDLRRVFAELRLQAHGGSASRPGVRTRDAVALEPSDPLHLSPSSNHVVDTTGRLGTGGFSIYKGRFWADSIGLWERWPSRNKGVTGKVRFGFSGLTPGRLYLLDCTLRREGRPKTWKVWGYASGKFEAEDDHILIPWEQPANDDRAWFEIKAVLNTRGVKPVFDCADLYEVPE